RVEVIADEKSFVFSAGDFDTARKRAPLQEGMVQTEDTVAATLLNGYEVSNPVGRKSTKAEIILLSSSVLKEVYDLIKRELAGFSHQRDIRFFSFPSVIYTALRTAFPYEKDYIALRVGGQATELVHVARGYPVAVARVDSGATAFARAADAA